MRTQAAARCGLFATGVLALLGCGDGTSEVSGTVKLDGQPVEIGAIMFIPVDGKTQTTGGPIKDGRYSVRVPIGTMKVSLSGSKVTGKKKLYDTPNSPWMDVTSEMFPTKYNQKTELRFDVPGGSVQKDWDVPSK